MVSYRTALFIVLIGVLVLLAAQQPNILGVPNSVSTVDINTSSSGTVVLVSHSGSQLIYVTHWHVMPAGTTNFSWVYGTGSNCGTGTTTIDGPIPMIAGTGVGAGVGLGTVLIIPSGQDLCYTNGSASQIGGSLSYQYGN